MESRRNELYRDVEEYVLHFLGKQGVDPALSRLAATGVVETLAVQWAGQVISFPRDLKVSLRLRWEEVAQKFDGSNYAALAREFGYTERHVRDVVARVTSDRKRADR